MFRKTLEEFMNDNQEKLMIDLRARADFEKETYPGALHIYHKEFYRYIDILPKNKKIYVFCYTGVTGDEIAEDLSLKGYDIYSIENGYRDIMRMNVHHMMEESQNRTEAVRGRYAGTESVRFGKSAQKI